MVEFCSALSDNLLGFCLGALKSKDADNTTHDGSAGYVLEGSKKKAKDSLSRCRTNTNTDLCIELIKESSDQYRLKQIAYME